MVPHRFLRTNRELQLALPYLLRVSQLMCQIQQTQGTHTCTIGAEIITY